MSHWPNKYVIGLTGNIATGKSVVRQMLQHLGAYTIDADGLSHQAMMPGAPAYKPIIQTFGQVIVGEDGRINRQMLGNIVFASRDAMTKLEAIVHPVVRQAVNVLVKRAQQPVVVIEAIKLLEGDLAQAVDTVWVVDSSPQTQYARLLQKRGMDKESAKQRMLAQNPQADKLKKADFIIRNDGDVEDTWRQVQKQWKLIQAMLGGEGAAPAAPAKPQAAPAPKPAAAPRPAAKAPDSPTRPKIPSETPAEPQPRQMAAKKTAEVPQAASDLDLDTGEIVVRRGMPSNAQTIADFIGDVTGRDISRMDIMLSFGEKSYLVAEDGEDVVGVMGWTVENLVTRMDEIYVAEDIDVEQVINAIIIEVEEASRELQSEVGFIFMPGSTSADRIDALEQAGYTTVTLKEIKIPAWREAVEEVLSGRQMLVYWKQLRKDRVLQPI